MRILIGEVIFFKSNPISDNRGYFLSGYNKEQFNIEIAEQTFVQQNILSSKLNVTRGLHFQIENPQAKLVSCISGKVIHVIMDIRLSSPTFGKMLAYELNHPSIFLYIPIGFAHGFLTLSQTAIFQCFVSDYWNKDGERGINFLQAIKDAEPIDIKTGYSSKPFTLCKTDNNLYILSDKDKLYNPLNKIQKKDLYA